MNKYYRGLFPLLSREAPSDRVRDELLLLSSLRDRSVVPGELAGVCAGGCDVLVVAGGGVDVDVLAGGADGEDAAGVGVSLRGRSGLSLVAPTFLGRSPVPAGALVPAGVVTMTGGGSHQG